MRKIAQLLSMILDAIVSIVDDNPRSQYIPVYEAREKFESGRLNMRDYNAAFEHNDSN